METCTKGLEEKLGVVNPYKPELLFYINDGVLEIWENKKGIDWLTTELLNKNSSDAGFAISILEQYSKSLDYFEEVWNRGYFSELEKLDGFINKLFEAMLGYSVMYFSSIGENGLSAIKILSTKLRENDKFFDESDKFIRKSLENIYPALSQFVTAIAREEIENPPKKEILEDRMRHSIISPSNKVEAITLDEYENKHTSYYFENHRLPSIDSTNKIIGTIAYKGLVTGIVRIVRRKNQVPIVKSGEIIVSPMTTPDFAPAMMIASAFVTDEGGIMCHAAITAREMKKPCIIGTKIATRVLKDGDVVEVNANTGIVKIIRSV
jgi:phosphohistidine swiveling domain-containing protein